MKNNLFHRENWLLSILICFLIAGIAFYFCFGSFSQTSASKEQLVYEQETDGYITFE